MRITLSALSKILQLTNTENAFRIQVTGSMTAGSHVDLIPNSKLTDSDVTICSVPLVIADFTSVNYLTNKSIDYDANAEEFIISNRGNE